MPNFTFATSSLTVQFTDDSLLAVSHSWNFGDGDTSTDINPIHTYAAAGTYDVTLTTTNAVGVARDITISVPVGMAINSPPRQLALPFGLHANSKSAGRLDHELLSSIPLSLSSAYREIWGS